MKLPPSLSPMQGALFGLIGFAAINLIVTAVGSVWQLGASGKHVVLKLTLLMIAIVIASQHPKGRGLLGLRVPLGSVLRSGGLLICGGLIGAFASIGILSTNASGVPLVRELSFLELVLTIWCLSSLAEEFYCRGLVQPWMDDQCDRVWTHPCVFASAILFGGMHLSLLFSGADIATLLIIVPSTTVLGYLCAVGRRESQSLWPPILTHIAFNVGGIAGAVAAVLFLRS